MKAVIVRLNKTRFVSERLQRQVWALIIVCVLLPQLVGCRAAPVPADSEAAFNLWRKCLSSNAADLSGGKGLIDSLCDCMGFHWLRDKASWIAVSQPQYKRYDFSIDVLPRRGSDGAQVLDSGISTQSPNALPIEVLVRLLGEPLGIDADWQVAWCMDEHPLTYRVMGSQLVRHGSKDTQNYIELRGSTAFPELALIRQNMFAHYSLDSADEEWSSYADGQDVQLPFPLHPVHRRIESWRTASVGPHVFVRLDIVSSVSNDFGQSGQTPKEQCCGLLVAITYHPAASAPSWTQTITDALTYLHVVGIQVQREDYDDVMASMEGGSLFSRSFKGPMSLEAKVFPRELNTVSRIVAANRRVNVVAGLAGRSQALPLEQ